LVGFVRGEAVDEPALQMQGLIAQVHAEVGDGVEIAVQLGNGFRVGLLFVDGIKE